jgi:hypothetical protein
VTRRHLGRLLRRAADRIDRAGAAKIMGWSFTFEEGTGIVFREDGRGCPLAYLGAADYARAHREAGSGLRPCCGTDPGYGHRGTCRNSVMSTGEFRP